MFKFIALSALASLSAVACASAPEGDETLSVEDTNIEGQASGFIPVKPVTPPVRYPPGAPYCGAGVSCRPIAVSPGGVITTTQPMLYSDSEGKATVYVPTGTRLTVPALMPILEAKQQYYGNPFNSVVCSGVPIPEARGSYKVTFTAVPLTETVK